MSRSGNLTIEYENQKGFILNNDEGVIFSQGAPMIYWKMSGGQDWICEKCNTADKIISSENKIIIELLFDCVKASIAVEKIKDNVWMFRGEIVNTISQSIEIARFHYWAGILHNDYDFLSTSVQGQSARKFSKNDECPPARRYLEKDTWGQWGVQWYRLNDPIHEQPNWATSVDVAVLLKEWKEQGLVIGFTGPGHAFGEIGFGTCCDNGIPFYASVLLDGIEMDPGEKRIMERMIIISGDWQNGMKLWAEKCGDELGTRKATYPLMGYCSWYQSGPKVTVDEILNAVQNFAKWPIPPGGRTIQIDDGFQIMPGDWRPNYKFDKEWEALPGIIEKNDFIPGLWLAPTAIFAHHPVMKSHPEWIQRLSDGSPAVSFSNWGWCKENVCLAEETFDHRTYFLDPDHPEARAFMNEIIQKAVRMGWKYLKLDFTYALSTARSPYNKKRTYFETLRELYRSFREAAGEETIICACIGGNFRYALGYADTARLGGDTSSHFASVANNLSDLIIRMCTNGIWWQGDPDVFYMRSENSKLSPIESWLLTGTLGLMGGVFLTSDSPSQWNADGACLVRYFWNSDLREVPISIRATRTSEGRIRALKCEQPNGTCRIGIYNWSNETVNICVTLNELDITSPLNTSASSILPQDREVIIKDDRIVSKSQEPHSLRIISLG